MKDEMTQKTEMAVLVTRRVPESHGGFTNEGLRLQAVGYVAGWWSGARSLDS